MKELIKHTEDLLYFIKETNRFSPFPIYDTEYVALVEKELKGMKTHKNKYDEGAVTACKFCNNLFILVDDLENDVCTKCGAINETVTFKDIFEYLDTIEIVDEDY